SLICLRIHPGVWIEMDRDILQIALTEREAATAIKVSVSLLHKCRRNSGGPPYVGLGRLVRYRLEDLQAWLAARTVPMIPGAGMRELQSDSVPSNRIFAAAVPNQR